MTRRTLLLLLSGLLLLGAAGCMRRGGEQGFSSFRCNGPSLVEPDPLTHSTRDRAAYLQYMP
ncbi:MAG: hypothetical protein ACOCYP_04885 [Planctomycetota bacterium]